MVTSLALSMIRPGRSAVLDQVPAAVASPSPAATAAAPPVPAAPATTPAAPAEATPAPAPK